MASGPIIDVRDRSRFPQFGLRAMFAVVAILAVLFAVMGIVGPVASIGLLFALVIVGLHVAGNALGTTLRETAPTEGPEKFHAHGAAAVRQIKVAALPPSRLYHRTSLGWIIWVTTVLGCAAGAWFGVTELSPWFGPSKTGIAVGAGSSAVLGAFFGFLSGCFLKMALTAWWQAIHVTDTRHCGDVEFANPQNAIPHTEPTRTPPLW
jgi:hypothetical protein